MVAEVAKLGFDRDMVVDSLRKRQQNKVPRAHVPNAQDNARVKRHALYLPAYDLSPGGQACCTMLTWQYVKHLRM